MCHGLKAVLKPAKFMLWIGIQQVHRSRLPLQAGHHLRCKRLHHLIVKGIEKENGADIIGHLRCGGVLLPQTALRLRVSVLYSLPLLLAGGYHIRGNIKTIQVCKASVGGHDKGPAFATAGI